MLKFFLSFLPHHKLFIYFFFYYLALFTNFYRSLLVTSNIYIRNFLVFFTLDILIIDDEPLWEPLEWSLFQSWILFLFLFSWIAETLITSFYGSFTGRDKRVYAGLLKAYWFMELWFMFNLAITGMFILTPFYYELTYKVSNVISWWSWYNRFFLFKFAIVWLFIDVTLQLIIINQRWLSWKKIFLLMSSILFYLFYIFYWQFIISFFGFFTDTMSFKNNNWIGFNKLSEGPYKTAWGQENRDIFSYKRTSLNIWYKNDSVYAMSLFFFNIFFFLSLSLLILQNLFIIKKIYSTKNISFTLLSYFISSLNNFFLCFNFFLFFILLVYIYRFMRYINDFSWVDFSLNYLDFILCC